MTYEDGTTVGSEIYLNGKPGGVSLTALPIIVNFSGALVAPVSPPANLKFEVDLSYYQGFLPLLHHFATDLSTDGWEYWNGVSMQPLTADGLRPAYQDEDVGLVTFTWTGSSGGSTYYVRYRSGYGDVWWDYRVLKVTS